MKRLMRGGLALLAAWVLFRTAPAAWLILGAFGAVAAYVLLVTVSMTRRCPACRGTLMIRRPRGPVSCTRCKGTGRTYRPGAVLVHRVLDDHLGGAVRGRVRPPRDDAEGPERW